MSAEPTVFVVDDAAAVRASLRALVESAGLAAETFASGESFLGSFDPSRPGCLVLDLRLGRGAGGLDVQEQLARRGSSLPIIVLTAHGRVPDSVRALKAGALDFLQKPVAPAKLLQSIREALAADAAQRKESAARRERQARLSRLTAREREVVELIVAGRTSKEIAATLGVSTRTVEAHRRAVYAKLQIDSAARLVAAVMASHR